MFKITREISENTYLWLKELQFKISDACEIFNISCINSKIL